MIDLDPIWLTLKLAGITTLLLFGLSVPLAFWLSQSKSRIKPVIETLVSMPLVLPPTVIGFYLLLLLSPNRGFGKYLNEVFDISVVFSFSGLVLASVVYSLPFMVQPIHSGLANLPNQLMDAGRSLGKTDWSILFRVLLPNIKPALLSGIVLTFAHTIGEFGVVLMIGGNIPGETRVASIAIYDQVEALNYSNANTYSLILFSITFSVVLLTHLFKDGGSWRLKI